MRNVLHYKEEAFEFYKKVLQSKKTNSKDIDYKARIQSLDGTIQSRFGEYGDNFNRNTLENISKSRLQVNINNKRDLLKLYAYQSTLIQKLKKVLTTTESNRIINTCPNCTIGEINSFDHYLPKEEFPEFVVNPKNLFPSCTKCNSYKNQAWLKGGERLFLNLYLDELPNAQYLFVDLTISIDVVTAHFFLDNDGSIDTQLFRLIKSHYDLLHLYERFCENTCEIITSLENLIYTYLQKLSLGTITALIIESENKNRQVFGYNYWKSILIIELMKNTDYLSRFQK